MGRHKKVKKSEISVIERWIANQVKVREKAKKRTWNEEVDTVCPWNVYEEKQTKDSKPVKVIKRNIKFKYKTKKEAKNQPKQTWQRLPIRFYKDYLHSKRELENLCIYLNGLDPAEYRAGIRYKIKTAYLPNRVVLEFIENTKSEFLNEQKKDITNRLNNFVRCGLNWFQSQSSKVNEWPNLQKRWGHCLLNLADNIEDEERIFEKGTLRSKNTILRIIWLMNNFMEHLHKEYPNRYSAIKFDPITPRQFAKLEKTRKNKKDYKKRRVINDLDWQKIKKLIAKDPQLKILKLCWEFGLRRSEALALALEPKNNSDIISSMCEDSLYIDKQLDELGYGKHDQPITKATKTGESRHIPYTASQSKMSAEEIYDLIESAEPIHPGEATKKWRKLLNGKKLNYVIHEMRHSFAYSIVNSVIINSKTGDGFSLKECMEILGHESIETTNKYIRHTKNYSENKFDIKTARKKKIKLA
ncbi:MAG: tyrosine-type recombinase/integrase [Bdellovibrionales bacterium]